MQRNFGSSFLVCLVRKRLPRINKVVGFETFFLRVKALISSENTSVLSMFQKGNAAVASLSACLFCKIPLYLF